ncbi:hypothetical protein J6W34_03495 [bacterium]|nr:hypothetical protein [bacterium]
MKNWYNYIVDEAKSIDSITKQTEVDNLENYTYFISYKNVTGPMTQKKELSKDEEDWCYKRGILHRTDKHKDKDGKLYKYEIWYK